MLGILNRLCAGEEKQGDVEAFVQLARAVKLGSLCGLGQDAPNPVLSTLGHFLQEHETHIYEKKCPANVCRALIEY